jgi:hypothetical protein
MVRILLLVPSRGPVEIALQPDEPDRPGGEARRVTTVTRLGCWINMIPAGG